MLRTTWFVLAACFAGSAAAQMPARPDPADPKASAPARPYESAFKDYRPYGDPEIASWRQVNEEVGRLKGHVGHVGNLGQVPQSPGAADKPGMKPPAQGGHGGPHK